MTKRQTLAIVVYFIKYINDIYGRKFDEGAAERCVYLLQELAGIPLGREVTFKTSVVTSFFVHELMKPSIGTLFAVQKSSAAVYVLNESGGHVRILLEEHSEIISTHRKAIQAMAEFVKNRTAIQINTVATVQYFFSLRKNTAEVIEEMRKLGRITLPQIQDAISDLQSFSA